LCCAACLLGVLSLFVLASGEVQDAAEIVRIADQKLRGEYSRGTTRIEIVRPSYTRALTMEHWSKGSDLYMLLITSPERDKGSAFLKRGKQIWNWLPSIERTVKLPPSMMTQSWMGTDFTNDDLVRQSSLVVDYTHAMLAEEQVSGRGCWKIELTPRPEAAVVWGRVVLWIDTSDYMQMRGEYYDEDGFLVNTVLGKEPMAFGGKLLPSVLEVIPADKEGYKTVMTTLSLDFDVKIEDAFFTQRKMRSLSADR
jgi:outer membrane lipoprotein-sorting protein